MGTAPVSMHIRSLKDCVRDLNHLLRENPAIV